MSFSATLELLEAAEAVMDAIHGPLHQLAPKLKQLESVCFKVRNSAQAHVNRVHLNKKKPKRKLTDR